MIDLDPLFPEPKTCPPPDAMLPNESRKMWEGVTEAIHARDYGRATQLKSEIEERQREKAAARATEGVEWRPRFFEAPALAAGRPRLSADGEKALKGLHTSDYKLEPAAVTGA